jgi:hypothetical protein
VLFGSRGGASKGKDTALSTATAGASGISGGPRLAFMLAPLGGRLSNLAPRINPSAGEAAVNPPAFSHTHNALLLSLTHCW